CIMYFVNPDYASGTYHTLEGLLMLGFGLSLLRAECWVLDLVVEVIGGGGKESPAPAAVEHERWPDRDSDDLEDGAATGVGAGMLSDPHASTRRWWQMTPGPR